MEIKNKTKTKKNNHYCMIMSNKIFIFLKFMKLVFDIIYLVVGFCNSLPGVLPIEMTTDPFVAKVGSVVDKFSLSTMIDSFWSFT